MSKSEANDHPNAKVATPPRRRASSSAGTRGHPPVVENSGTKSVATSKSSPSRRQRATRGAITGNRAPAADQSSSGTSAVAKANLKPSRRRRAKGDPATQAASPSVETSQATTETSTTGSGREGASLPSSADPTTPVCLRLAQLQRKRMFCIVSQSRIDRAMDAALAGCLGYKSSIEDEADRKALFRRAGAIRRAIEEGKQPDLPLGDQRSDSLDDFLPLIPLSAHSRAPWDDQRRLVELEMRRLARTLPVFEWVREDARGVGDLGLARIVGEAPLINAYATHQRLWKRLGLAVIGDQRQQKRTDLNEAMLHGYSPRRRAEVWSVCSDTMFRAQWRGGEDEAPGFAIGAYGEVYRLRKLHTQQRIEVTADLAFADRNKWTKKRCDSDARRIMAKAFLEDLWRVWRGLPALYPSRWTGTVAEAAE